MHRRFIAVTTGVAAMALALTGCAVPPPSGPTFSVAMSGTGCDVSGHTAPSGTTTFTITNSGHETGQFQVFASDRLRIVGVQRDVAPGAPVSYAAHLQPGSYFTGCTLSGAATAVGLAPFTVSGQVIAVDHAVLADDAVANYVSFLQSQAAQLEPGVTEFAKAYMAGDDTKARSLYASSRVAFERIEPTGDDLGELDADLDAREVDAIAAGGDWNGFHRIEKDLWPPAPDALNSDGTSAFAAGWAASTPEERTVLGQALIDDMQSLSALVNDPGFTVELSDISDGAIELLEEIAEKKVTGEEEWWSHTDLSDFAANLQGAFVAFETVKPIVAAKNVNGASVVADIESHFETLTTLLAQYGSLDSGFVAYDTVSDAQRSELSDGVDALASPLANLTHAVIGGTGS